MNQASPVMDRLLDFRGAAFQLAFRILRGRDGAEDVVQQAYLELLKSPPPALPERELRTWFLRLAANTAKAYVRSEVRRKRREQNVTREPAVLPGEELTAALRQALDGLEDKHRLPLSLCYEQGLSQQEAAAILETHQATVSRHITEGLELLCKVLVRAGYTAAPAMVIGALAHTAPAVPATLMAALAKLVSEAAVIKGTGAAAASAAAKGGIVMKIIVSVVAAGVLAGAVAVVHGVGAGFKPAPTMLASPPAAAPTEGKPAPINEYKGMQEREEVFEFTEKPKVTKDGDKWVVTFASKGKCDATVAILDKDGKIIRHLASGVLGKNAPWPFQQNSLAQKIEWDGLTDTFKKAEAAGCKVKVGLGLQAKFERNIGYDPYLFPTKWVGAQISGTAIGANGEVYVAIYETHCTSAAGRVFDKDGKYLRTFWPPPAKDIDKIGAKLTTTIWGDKTPWEGWFGPFEHARGDGFSAGGKKMVAASGVEGWKEGPRPAAIGESKLPYLYHMRPHISVDASSEMVYAGWSNEFRFNGRTGESLGALKGWGGEHISVTPDGVVYSGSNEEFIVLRTGPDGKRLPFKENAWPGPENWPSPPIGALMTGGTGSNGHGFSAGLHVAPDGTLVVGIWGWIVDDPQLLGNPKVLEVLTGDGRVARDRAKKLGVKILGHGTFIAVFDRDGKLLTNNAVQDMTDGYGVAMDRDGNIYTARAMILPAGQKLLDGVANCPEMPRAWGGSIIKFRGLGGKFPLGKMYRGGRGTEKVEAPPADALKLAGNRVGATGALWAYGGISNQEDVSCNCNHSVFHLDLWARSWVPNNAVSGVMVIDSNGNRIMRMGRYGNVDDTEADLKEKKDGLRFAYIRGCGATDTAAYVMDPGSSRILKAALSYAAEETVPAP